VQLRRWDPRWPSALALVVANLLPVYGVLAWDWSALALLVTYWAEVVLVGVFSLLRFLFAYPLNFGAWLLKVVVLPFSPFFLMPFFVVVLGLSALIITFVGTAETAHAFVSILFAWSRGKELMPLDQALQVLGFQLGPRALIVIGAFAASHLLSFVWNYLIRGECNRIGLVALLVLPIARLWLISIVMTLALVGADRLAAPVWLLVGLVGIKIAFDLFAHLKEHRVGPLAVALQQGT
jgi:hypothetical protein